MNHYKKISKDLLRYSLFAGLLIGCVVSVPTFFLKKEHLFMNQYRLGLFFLLILSNIFFIRNYASKVTSLDYREVFSISFLILFICTFISQISFGYFHENEYRFNFTEYLTSILPIIPISFLLATFLKKQN